MDKSTVIQMLRADIARFNQESLEISKTIQDYKTDAKNYMDALLSQITTSGRGPLLTKTPKIPKKKGTRIKAIPENDEVECDTSLSDTRMTRSSRAGTILETSEIYQGRSKRGASIKATDNIKKQQSMTLSTKLRRPSNDEDNLSLANKQIKESRSKRPKESLASSEEEDIRPSKLIKIEKRKTQTQNKIQDETHDVINDSTQDVDENQTMQLERSKRISVKRKLEQHDEDANATLTSEQSSRQKSLASDEPAAKKANYSKISPQKSEKDLKYTSSLERISEKSVASKQSEVLAKRTTRSSRSSASVINAQGPNKYKTNVINETVDMSNADETVASMYEDAISKPTPIMNSTMNPNTTVTLERMMNATVVIEPLSTKKIFNETVTIKKSSFKEPLSHNNSTIKESPEKHNTDVGPKSISNAKNTTINYGKTKAKTQKDIKIDKLTELLTDDESSPERKGYRVMKDKLSNQQKRVTRSTASITSDDDEVLQTPIKTVQKNKDLKVNALKAAYKPAALFSPYAKDSVKKRVEAFELVASPKTNENETGGRITRTKTRALAAATSFSEAPAPTVTQKLARKSLAKAKKISLAKQARDFDETKENENTNTIKPVKKTSSVEKAGQKSQLKTTPLGKRMLQMPSSVNKNQYATPSNTYNHNAYSKPLTASRGNIVTHVDSFIQPMKSAQKTIDRAAEEKRRRAHEEDARRKREELLKSQAEEKRRKREEKELKNKLAREAKEKLEYEKRLKAEKEREEKAKLAQQMQEKQREEMEKKRLAQIQRAQEKEERRKQEEQLRLQRLQEQEEQERQLAEQKRREQEMEKRKQLTEMKLKNQMDKALLQAKAKMLSQKQMPTNYKIDSDPDEEESDDESKPKYQIPPWASKHVRQAQLAMQQYIPMKVVLRFFDAKKCTPDLRELFIGIDPKKLKRSSSAIWKTPPRYSMMDYSTLED